MTLTKPILIFLLTFYCAFISANNIEKLEYLTEHHAPYNFLDQTGEPQGYAYELLQEVWFELGLPNQAIKVLPWATAYSRTQENRNTVLFSATKISSREKMFKWACSIIDIKVVLLGLRENSIRIRSMEEARNHTIVSVKFSDGERLLRENHFNEKQIFQVDKMETALKIVLLGGIDLISTTEQDAYRMLRKIGQDPYQFDVAWTLKSTPICYAFNRRTSNHTIEIFQQALENVQKNKTLINQLKHKYDLGK